MKIKSLKIKNFKAIDDLEINFTSNKNGAEVGLELDILKLSKDKKTVIPYVNYIIGRNSIGKTSALEAIVFFAKYFSSRAEVKSKEILKKELIDSYKVMEKDSIEKNDYMQKIEKEIQNKDHSKKQSKIRNRIYFQEYKRFARDTKKEIKIDLTFDYEKELTISLIYPSLKISKEWNSYQPIVNFLNNNSKSSIHSKIIDWANNTLHLCSDDIKRDITTPKNQNNHYLDEQFSIPNIIFYLEKNKNSLKNLDSFIRLANPRFIEFVHKDIVKIGYVEKGVSINKDVNRLSSGTKKFLKLLHKIIIFARLKSGILIIDDIENNIHKELINIIKMGLSIITKKYDLQVIITTHNPLILSEFTLNKQIITLDDQDNKIIASKVSSKMKPKNSVVKKYENNEISMFPNPEYAEKISREIFTKW